MRLRALLFDYGGTLDAPGVPWVERFLEIYRNEGLAESEERIRAAFGHATRCAYADPRLASFSLEQTVTFHVAHQSQFLGRTDAGMDAVIAQRFMHLARTDLAKSRSILERLHDRFRLGVISNFYGNVHLLLAEAAIAPLLSAIIDSTRVGVSKPDPAIFRMALEQVGCAASEAMYVGDSFEKDIVGAHATGLRTAWLVGAANRSCPDTTLVDLRLRSLAELAALSP
jgi:putative hydrolase of the HAD superfamily